MPDIHHHKAENGRVFCIQTTLMQIGANSVGISLNILSKRGIYIIILCTLYIRPMYLVIFHNENTLRLSNLHIYAKDENSF